MTKIKKVTDCPAGGFIKVQQKLLEEQEIHCDACKLLLARCKFNHEDLKEMVESVVKGLASVHPLKDIDSTAKDENPVPASQETQEARFSKKKYMACLPSCRFLGGAHLFVVLKLFHSLYMKHLTVAQVDNSEEAGAAFARKFEPYIEILPAGAFGKKQPYRCHLCKNAKQPMGRVGELVSMKLWNVRRFLTQHTEAHGHIRALELAQTIPVQVEKTQCEALCICDEDTAGKLYVFRGEFHLWASLANFKQNAKHKYWQDANSDSWFVRSAECEGETSVHPNLERQVCGACLSLGATTGVSGHKIS